MKRAREEDSYEVFHENKQLTIYSLPDEVLEKIIAVLMTFNFFYVEIFEYIYVLKFVSKKFHSVICNYLQKHVDEISKENPKFDYCSIEPLYFIPTFIYYKESNLVDWLLALHNGSEEIMFSNLSKTDDDDLISKIWETVGEYGTEYIFNLLVLFFLDPNRKLNFAKYHPYHNMEAFISGVVESNNVSMLKKLLNDKIVNLNNIKLEDFISDSDWETSYSNWLGTAIVYGHVEILEMLIDSCKFYTARHVVPNTTGLFNLTFEFLDGDLNGNKKHYVIHNVNIGQLVRLFNGSSLGDYEKKRMFNFLQSKGIINESNIKNVKNLEKWQK